MAEAKIVVDVEASYLSAMQHKIDTWGKLNEAENFTIFRAPRDIDQTKMNLLEPSVISIGPLHHGQMSLRAMEEKKWRFLRHFLSCGNHISLDLCISEMKLLEERARRCYSEMTENIKSHEFVEMMLLDGCFVLKYFLQDYKLFSNFEFGWNNASIFTDLLLLENQIPFFVVEKLYEIGIEQKDKQEGKKKIVDHLIPFLNRGPTNYHRLIENPPTEFDHLVHLYYHFSVPYKIEPVVLTSKSFHLTRMLCPNRIKKLLRGFLLWGLPRSFSGATFESSSVETLNSTCNTLVLVIPCASELQDAGIKFKPKNKPRHMLDISFDHGDLEIPSQLISRTTKPCLTNLVAFEQNKLGQVHEHLTSFVVFLNLLINTQKDAIILQQCGIIHNLLSSEEELTTFFNQVGDGVILRSNHYLAELFEEVNKYYESRWHKNRAKLIRDYFSSPWAAISLVAALVLLILTCVQTFFSVYAYYIPPSP